MQILQRAEEEGYGKAAAKFMVKAAMDKVIAEEEGYAKAAAKLLAKAALEKVISQVSQLSSQIELGVESDSLLSGTLVQTCCASLR